MSAQLGSGLAFPLGVDQRGAIALATGETDIEQAIAIILSTSPGERPMRPEFGCAVHEHVFDVLDPEAFGAIESAVRSAIERWEPRASVQAIDFDLDQRSEGCLNIVLTYEIPDVPGVRNLVHPFYIIPEEEGADGEVVDAEVVAW
jgi:phage baseplate assembly protein W